MLHAISSHTVSFFFVKTPICQSANTAGTNVFCLAPCCIRCSRSCKYSEMMQGECGSLGAIDESFRTSTNRGPVFNLLKCEFEAIFAPNMQMTQGFVCVMPHARNRKNGIERFESRQQEYLIDCATEKLLLETSGDRKTFQKDPKCSRLGLMDMRTCIAFPKFDKRGAVSPRKDRMVRVKSQYGRFKRGTIVRYWLSLVLSGFCCFLIYLSLYGGP